MAEPPRGFTQCGQCGAMAPTGSKFCAECGSPIGTTEAAAPPGETRDQYLARINTTKLGGKNAGKPAKPSDPAKPQKQQMPNGCAIGCLVVIALAIIGAILGALGIGNSSSNSTGDLRYGAWDVCQQFVDRRLKAPSSSRLPRH